MAKTKKEELLWHVNWKFVNYLKDMATYIEDADENNEVIINVIYEEKGHEHLFLYTYATKQTVITKVYSDYTYECALKNLGDTGRISYLISACSAERPFDMSLRAEYNKLILPKAKTVGPLNSNIYHELIVVPKL